MRALNIKDSFRFSEIIDKMVLDSTLEEIMEKGQKNGQEWAGKKLVVVIFKKMYMAEKELINLLASVAEVEPKELEDKPIMYLKDLFTQITKDPQFKDFFQSAGNE